MSNLLIDPGQVCFIVLGGRGMQCSPSAKKVTGYHLTTGVDPHIVTELLAVSHSVTKLPADSIA